MDTLDLVSDTADLNDSFFEQGEVTMVQTSAVPVEDELQHTNDIDDNHCSETHHDDDKQPERSLEINGMSTEIKECESHELDIEPPPHTESQATNNAKQSFTKNETQNEDIINKDSWLCEHRELIFILLGILFLCVCLGYFWKWNKTKCPPTDLNIPDNWYQHSRATKSVPRMSRTPDYYYQNFR